MCPECSDRQWDPGLTLQEAHPFCPPPLPIIGEGRRVTRHTLSFWPVPTRLQEPLNTIPISPPHRHIHFLVIGLSYFLKYSRGKLGYPNTSLSLRMVSEGCWNKGCPTFSFSLVVPREHRLGIIQEVCLERENLEQKEPVLLILGLVCLLVCFIKSRM